MPRCLIFCLLLFGCASSQVMLGEARAPISPDEVKIYSRPPTNYQEIALIESSSKNSFAVSDQGKMETAIRRLKEVAAKIGANGIIINGTGEQRGAAVAAATSPTTAVGMAALHKYASGVAIYVDQE